MSVGIFSVSRMIVVLETVPVDASDSSMTKTSMTSIKAISTVIPDKSAIKNTDSTSDIVRDGPSRL